MVDGHGSVKPAHKKLSRFESCHSHKLINWNYFIFGGKTKKLEAHASRCKSYGRIKYVATFQFLTKEETRGFKVFT